MRAALRRLLAHAGGASAVEFALVAGPLLLIMFGTVEFGRLMWARQALEETATRGARCMGIPQEACTRDGGYDPAATRAYIVEAGRAIGIDIEPGNVELDRAASCSGLSGFSRVRVTVEFRTALPGVVSSLGVPRDLVTEVCFPNQV